MRREMEDSAMPIARPAADAHGTPDFRSWHIAEVIDIAIYFRLSSDSGSFSLDAIHGCGAAVDVGSAGLEGGASHVADKF